MVYYNGIFNFPKHQMSVLRLSTAKIYLYIFVNEFANRHIKRICGRQ